MTKLDEACLYHAQAAPHGPKGLDGSSEAMIGTFQVKLQKPNDISIGTEVWPASRVMLNWFTSADNAPMLEGTTILELGSGAGALAMGLVSYAGVSRVFASEGEQDVYENLCANVAFNNMDSFVVPCVWDWEDSVISPLAQVDLDKVDMFIGSDIVYLGTGSVLLSHALAILCRPRVTGAKGKQAWLLLADRPQGGEQFLPPSKLDEGIDPEYDIDGRRLSAVGSFLYSCSRRGLTVNEIDIDPALIAAATQEANCVNGRREFEGRLALYCVQQS